MVNNYLSASLIALTATATVTLMLACAPPEHSIQSRDNKPSEPVMAETATAVNKPDMPGRSTTVDRTVAR